MPDLVFLVDEAPSEKQYSIILNFTDRKWFDSGSQDDSILNAAEILPVALSKEIYDQKYADTYMTFRKFISAAKSSKGVIGTRLHAVVMGVIAGVPVAGITYEDKVERFCQIQYSSF